MKEKDIIEFVRRHVEPLKAGNGHAFGYRVAATLFDGTTLPCVIIERARDRVVRAISRMDALKREPEPGFSYHDCVALFVCRGNVVSADDIRDVAISPYAIPPARLAEVGGETSIGSTAFRVVMRDGAEFDFATNFRDEFFEMPAGYSGADIAKIESQSRTTVSNAVVYREKPFFRCCVEGL
jgi:hypothetical protein